MYRERRAVRVDDYATADGDIAEHASKHEITLRDRLPDRGQRPPLGLDGRRPSRAASRSRRDAEQRVTQFTELVATAIANAQARDELRRLADEQAALRRVATLVAEAAPPPEVFDAVIVEVARCSTRASSG